MFTNLLANVFLVNSKYKKEMKEEKVVLFFVNNIILYEIFFSFFKNTFNFY